VARYILAQINPNDVRFEIAVWANHDQITKWKVTTAALDELFTQGAEEIRDPVKGPEFLKRFEIWARTLNNDQVILIAFGKDALSKPADAKKRMRAVAVGKGVGQSWLAYIIVGA
jgi:hypothetical protein